MRDALKREALRHGIRGWSVGEGETVVMVPGWPQTGEAFLPLVPHLAGWRRLLVLDPPGLGDSEPAAGYDTGSVSRAMAEAVDGVVKGPYDLVGHDVGAWIGYAWAAQTPDRVRSLAVLDASILGCTPPQTFPLPEEANLKLWQFSFNALPELPEQLTRGREGVLLDWLFEKKSRHPERISTAQRARYTRCYARPGAMENGFAYYRAAAASAAQNQDFSRTKLRMPVLALGGELGVGDLLRQTMEGLADTVSGGTIAECGHYMMEEQPEAVADALLRFWGAGPEVDARR